MNPWIPRAYQIAESVGHPDPDMFVRQMLAESGLRPGRTSPAGAQGIAQIMPATAAGWGVDPNDPVAALTAAAKAMSKYIRSYNGNAAMALAAYNAGPGAVQRYNGVPPYSETRNYIKKIMGDRTFYGPASQQKAVQAPQTGPQVDPTAVSNQINRIQYAYMDAPELAQPHIDKLSRSLYSGALSNTAPRPAAAGSTQKEGKGFFARKAGETGQQYLDRLLMQKFGLRHDPGNAQTTGGRHTTGSLHYQGLATDFGNARNPANVLQRAENWIDDNRDNFAGGIAELLYGEGDHADHLHVATQRSLNQGIKKSPINPPPSIRPANTRRRPVKRKRTQHNAPR